MLNSTNYAVNTASLKATKNALTEPVSRIAVPADPVLIAAINTLKIDVINPLRSWYSSLGKEQWENLEDLFNSIDDDLTNCQASLSNLISCKLVNDLYSKE